MPKLISAEPEVRGTLVRERACPRSLAAASRVGCDVVGEHRARRVGGAASPSPRAARPPPCAAAARARPAARRAPAARAAPACGGSTSAPAPRGQQVDVRVADGIAPPPPLRQDVGDRASGTSASSPAAAALGTHGRPAPSLGESASWRSLGASLRGYSSPVVGGALLRELDARHRHALEHVVEHAVGVDARGQRLVGEHDAGGAARRARGRARRSAACSRARAAGRARGRRGSG